MKKEDEETKEDLENAEEESGLEKPKEDEIENEPKQESLDDLLKNEDSKKELAKKQNSQVKLAILLMAAVIIIIFLVPFIIKEANKFEYIGLEFQKTQLGDIFFYSTRFPVVNIQGQIIGDYSINFRNDPRELEYIKVDVPDKRIEFLKNTGGQYNLVYLAINPSMDVCGDSGIAMLNLAGFLRDSGLEVESAVTNKTYAEETGYPYVNCLENPVNTIIRVSSTNSSETAIYKTTKNCYDIVFKNCEIIPVSEKFALIILEEYMSHFREVEEEETYYFNIDLEEENTEQTNDEEIDNPKEGLNDLLNANQTDPF